MSNVAVCRCTVMTGVLWTFCATSLLLAAGGSKDVGIAIDQGHSWCEPFGLERVGSPWKVSVTCADAEASRVGLSLSLRASGREITSRALKFAEGQRRSRRIELDEEVEEVIVVGGRDGEKRELARASVERPNLEVDATASPATMRNPVDLGVILPPSDWLLLGPGQTAVVDVAMLSRLERTRIVTLAAWCDGTPEERLEREVTLGTHRRMQFRLEGIRPKTEAARTVLHVTLSDPGGEQLWHKEIPVMLVHSVRQFPGFGATDTALRYDAPISVRDPVTGSFSEIPYEGAWGTELRDVVVTLPTGARFVFWRGASYIPFWAGPHNTGICYEWAERLPPHPPGAVDCVEPLMDKELRYGRVEIVSSTAARVHVRWRYQSTDLEYQVWGDEATEDYYFYPDGFGTRALSLKREPGSEYELSEFIILTAAETYPWDVLPTTAVEAVYPDRKVSFSLPLTARPSLESARAETPALYRIRAHKDDPMTAIYFNSSELDIPKVLFGPFFDSGEMVTPAYWGSHWPLARGNATGSRIDDRVHITPCHNSLMSWADDRPSPIQSGIVPTVDALGQSRPMVVEKWAWLIGMSDAGDEELVVRANSFSRPPSLVVEGGRLELQPYAIERRAVCLRVEQRRVSITLTPSVPWVNPVFELTNAPGLLVQVRLGDRDLAADEYAWDGSVLWLGRTVESPTTLRLEFEGQ